MRRNGTCSEKFIILSFQPVIPPDVVDSYKNDLNELLERERLGPEEKIADFTEYFPYVTGKVS